MKTLLIYLIIFVGGYTSSLAQNTSTQKQQVPLYKGNKGAIPVRPRAFIINPAQAFTFVNELSIIFLEPANSATILVTNVLTNEIVYQESYQEVDNIVIDLSGLSIGEYQVEISSQEWTLFGDFIL